MDALGLPAGARILDTRVNPHEKIIVRPPKTDLALLEKIVGELPKAAVPIHTPTGEPSRLVWLVIANVGVVLVIVGAFLLRRVVISRRKQAEHALD